MSRKTTVVIVNYNTRDILQKCLEHLEDTQDVDVVVVDNDSPDGSAEMVKNKFKKVKLLALEKNVGLSAGYNKALKEIKTPYVLFMGSDAFPDKGATEVLENYFEINQKAGIGVGKVRLRNGEMDRDTHRGFPTPWVALTHFSGLEKLFPKTKLFGKYFMAYANMNGVHEIDMCTSHFMFTRREMLEELGGWDESFFVYGEDVDMCWRAKHAGWKVMYIPQATVLHYKGATVGIRKESSDISTANEEIKMRMLKESTEAMKKFYVKHYSGKWYSPLVMFGIGLLASKRAKKTA